MNGPTVKHVAAEVTRLISIRNTPFRMRKALIPGLLLCGGCLLAPQTGLAEQAPGAASSDTSISFTLTAPANAKDNTIQKIIGSESSMSDRLRAVHSLPDNLTAGEISVLFEFLKSPSTLEGQDLAALHGLKNDILNVLRHQAEPPVGFTAAMVALYRDPAQDSVMRDYAIQHLVTWHEQDAPDAPESKSVIAGVFREAARDASSSIAGPALLGMHRLSIQNAASTRAFSPSLIEKPSGRESERGETDSSNFNPEEIDHLALSLALSPETHRATRITAIQVCAERGVKAALPTIESLPQQSGTLPLRLSAIAALGRLGGRETLPQLRQLETNQTAELMAAIRAALRQWKQKESPLY